MASSYHGQLGMKHFFSPAAHQGLGKEAPAGRIHKKGAAQFKIPIQIDTDKAAWVTRPHARAWSQAFGGGHIADSAGDAQGVAATDVPRPHHVGVDADAREAPELAEILRVELDGGAQDARVVRQIFDAGQRRHDTARTRDGNVQDQLRSDLEGADRKSVV